RVVESQGKIGPTIRIGKKVVIGTKVEEYDEKIHTQVDFEFDIDPKFRPVKKEANSNGEAKYTKRETYNSKTVEFFIEGIKLWHESQKNFYERTWLTYFTELFNAVSFPWTNYFGAAINAFIIFDFLKGWDNTAGRLLIGIPSLGSL